MNKFRIACIFASIVAAAAVASYGHDTKHMGLWAIGMLWISAVMLAQLWPAKKKKRHRRNGDTHSHSIQPENSTDLAEVQ